MVAHSAAEPDKGTGIAMCCTFGDLTDVNWWRELQLPARVIIGRDGRIVADKPEWIKNVDRLGGDCGKDDLQCAGGRGGGAARFR